MKKMLPNKIDIELIEAAKLAAKKENRSLNNWLENLIRSAVSK
jgi:predicted HicB family RNase H-like nuclease